MEDPDWNKFVHERAIICPQNKDLDIVDDDVADHMMVIEYTIG